MGNANVITSDFGQGESVKKLLVFLTLVVFLALPLACGNRAFNTPVSPIVAPTPTPSLVWSYQPGVYSPPSTP